VLKGSVLCDSFRCSQEYEIDSRESKGKWTPDACVVRPALLSSSVPWWRSVSRWRLDPSAMLLEGAG